MNKKIHANIDREMITDAYNSIFPDIETKPFHKIILKTEKELKKAEPYHSNMYSGLYRSAFDIRVTESSLQRALKVANCFILVVEKLGFKAIKDTSSFQINDEIFSIRIKEFFKQSKHIPTSEEKLKARTERYYNIPSFDLNPSGELAFVLKAESITDKVFRDKPNLKIESQIVDVISEMIEFTHLIKESREQTRLRNELFEQEKQRRYEHDLLEQLERKKLEQLESEANDLHRAKLIQEYIKEVEFKSKLYKLTDEQKLELKQWIRWAKNKSEWLNPLVGKDDPILGQRHKNILSKYLNK